MTATFEVRNSGNVRLSGEQAVAGHGLFGLGKHTMVPGDLPEILPGQSIVVTVQLEGVAPLVWVTEKLVIPSAINVRVAAKKTLRDLGLTVAVIRDSKRGLREEDTVRRLRSGSVDRHPVHCRK